MHLRQGVKKDQAPANFRHHQPQGNRRRVSPRFRRKRLPMRQVNSSSCRVWIRQSRRLPGENQAVNHNQGAQNIERPGLFCDGLRRQSGDNCLVDK
jgi:hypothetical protein